MIYKLQKCPRNSSPTFKHSSEQGWKVCFILHTKQDQAEFRGRVLDITCDIRRGKLQYSRSTTMAHQHSQWPLPLCGLGGHHYSALNFWPCLSKMLAQFVSLRFHQFQFKLVLTAVFNPFQKKSPCHSLVNKIKFARILISLVDETNSSKSAIKPS